MSWIRFLTPCAVALVLVLPLTVQSQEMQSKQDSDLSALARTLVNDCARIQAGEMVLLRGGSDDIRLLEDLAIEARKTKGTPLVTLFTPRLARGLLEAQPVEPKSEQTDAALKLADSIQAQIVIESFDLEQALAGITPERRAQFNRHEQAVQEKLLSRHVKQVTVGNGLYPLASRAKRFGTTQEELAKVFWKGVNTDYSRLAARCAKAHELLSHGKSLHVTHVNGTDLVLRIERRPVFGSDGVLSPEKIKRGGAACQVWLPAGEVFLAPTPGSAEGKIVIDRVFFENAEILGLHIKIKNGKVVAWDAAKGIEPLLGALKAASAGKDEVGYFDIGLNPDVVLLPKTKMLAWMAAGMVTVGVGNNGWAGGDNKTSFDLIGHMPDCTVTLDGRTILKKGALQFE